MREKYKIFVLAVLILISVSTICDACGKRTIVFKKKAIELLLPRLTVDEFFGIIDKEKSSSWNDGYNKAQYDIRKALGI